MSKYDALATLGVGLMQFGSQMSDRQLRREQLANEKARQDALLKLEQRKADFTETKFAWEQERAKVEDKFKKRELGVREATAEATAQQAQATMTSALGNLAEKGLAIGEDGHPVVSRDLMDAAVELKEAGRTTTTRPTDYQLRVEAFASETLANQLSAAVDKLTPEQAAKVEGLETQTELYKALSGMKDENGAPMVLPLTTIKAQAHRIATELGNTNREISPEKVNDMITELSGLLAGDLATLEAQDPEDIKRYRDQAVDILSRALPHVFPPGTGAAVPTGVPRQSAAPGMSPPPLLARPAANTPPPAVDTSDWEAWRQGRG